jgi:hypothetical protein
VALFLLLTQIFDLELPLGVKDNIVPPEVAIPLGYHELSWLPYYGISSFERISW